MDVRGNNPIIGTHRTIRSTSPDRAINNSTLRTNSFATQALSNSESAPSSSKSYNRIVRIMKIHVEYKALMENDNRTPQQNKRMQHLVKEARKESLEAQVTEFQIINAIQNKTEKDYQRLEILDDEINQKVAQNFNELQESYNNLNSTRSTRSTRLT